MEVAKESLTVAIDELFNSYTRARLRIGLVSFGTTCTYSDEPDQNSRLDMVLTDSSGRQALKDAVATYRPQSCTPTMAGVNLGIRQLFTSEPGTKQILILMSDGEPNGREAEVQRVADVIREPRYADFQFYSAAITSDTRLKAWMEHMSGDDCGRSWSSTSADECKPKNNVEYAYAAGNAAGIRAMYDGIVDSILGVTVRYLTSTSGVLQGSAGTIRSGKGIPLPFPEGFVCSPTGGNQTVRFSVAFNAQGTVNFSNFKLTYCPVR